MDPPQQSNSYLSCHDDAVQIAEWLSIRPLYASSRGLCGPREPPSDDLNLTGKETIAVTFSKDQQQLPKTWQVEQGASLLSIASKTTWVQGWPLINNDCSVCLFYVVIQEGH